MLPLGLRVCEQARRGGLTAGFGRATSTDTGNPATNHVVLIKSDTETVCTLVIGALCR